MATPSPGGGVPVTAPVPNPAQYNAVAGTVISANNYNSTIYKMYNDLSTVINALNACSYVNGNTVSSVVANNGLSASLSSCNPGTGRTLTIGFAGGGIPAVASYFSSTANPAGFRWPGDGSTSAMKFGVGAYATGGSLTCHGNVMSLTDAADSNAQYLNVDSSGNLCIGGNYYNAGSVNTTNVIASNYVQAVTANISGNVNASNVIASSTVQSANSIVSGTAQAANTNITNTAQEYNTTVTNLLQANNVQISGNPSIIRSATPFVIPFIAQATSGTGHMEIGTLNVTMNQVGTSTAYRGCATNSFSVNFATAPATMFNSKASTLVSSGMTSYQIFDDSSTASQVRVCIDAIGPLSVTTFVQPLYYLAVGP